MSDAFIDIAVEMEKIIEKNDMVLEQQLLEDRPGYQFMVKGYFKSDKVQAEKYYALTKQ